MNKLNDMEKYNFWEKVKEFSSLLYFMIIHDIFIGINWLQVLICKLKYNLLKINMYLDKLMYSYVHVHQFDNILFPSCLLFFNDQGKYQ